MRDEGEPRAERGCYVCSAGVGGGGKVGFFKRVPGNVVDVFLCQQQPFFFYSTGVGKALGFFGSCEEDAAEGCARPRGPIEKLGPGSRIAYGTILLLLAAILYA